MSTNITTPIVFDTDEIKDALIYSSINNVITPINFLNNNATYWDTDSNGNSSPDTSKEKAYINFTQLIDSNVNNSNTKIDSIISNTTIKRACCLKNEDLENPDHYIVNIKLPYIDNLSYCISDIFFI